MLYTIKLFKTLFFIIIVITIITLIIIAIITDNNNKQILLKNKKLLKTENQYKCIENIKMNNKKKLDECAEEYKYIDNRIEKILKSEQINISLVKIMINSSIEGAIQGSIFGYIIGKTEGLFAGFLIFAILNPLMKFISHFLMINSKII